MTVVAILYVVPTQPADGIEFYAKIPRFLDVTILRALISPNLAGVLVPPHGQNGRDFVISALNAVHCRGRVAVGDDVLPIGDFVCLCSAFRPADDLAGRNLNVRLRLHIAVIGVSEEHASVRYDLRLYAALDAVARLNGFIPIGVHTTVAVDSGVSGELSHKRRDVVHFGQKLKFVVDDAHRLDKVIGARRLIEQGRIDLDVVRGYRSCSEADNALDDVELRRGKPVCLNALPLLADVKILVALDSVVEVYGVVEL